MSAKPKPDPDAGSPQSLAEIRAQEAAQDAAAAAATEAAAEGASPSEAKQAAREAAEEALANYRLHEEDVDRIANRNAERTIAALREGGAFDQSPAQPAAPAPTEAAPADTVVVTEVAPPAAAPAAAPPPPVTAPEPPRKLTLAERFAGVERD